MTIPLLDLKAQYNSLRKEIQERIDHICEQQHFILGPQVEQFEKETADYCRTRFAIGMSSGTDALVCALMAIDLKPGDEVITSPYTFFATAGSIARLGAKPVFVDIDPETFNIDSARIEQAITPKTRAIIPVHLFGQCADMVPICDLARRYKLTVIEDAAQAIGSQYHGRPAGSLGDMACLSFFPSKNLGGFGDGGMITTDNPELEKKIKALRMHGEVTRYHHQFIGANFRLDALQAGVLSVKLRYLDAWHQARQKNAAIYDQLFSGSPVKTPHIADGNTSVYNQYCIRVPDRDRVIEHLKDREIGHAIYYPVPLHLQACFEYLGYHVGDFPHTEGLAKQALAIPIYPELTPEQIHQVAKTIRETLST